MVELECRACGYKFKNSRMVSRCPYCSKEGFVGLKKQAQDLIDETLGETELMDEEREKRKI